MMRSYLGISRERVYSPGRVVDDAAILAAVAASLRAGGEQVDLIDGDAAEWPSPSPDTIVFTMAQGPRALELSADWRRRGLRIVNDAQAIANCHRHRTVALLQPAQVGFPETELIDLERSEAPAPEWRRSSGAWVKRGDVHATEADDVVFARTGEEIGRALQRLAARGVGRAALQRHIEGTVFKFYGVGERFFHYVLPPSAAPLPADLATRFANTAARAARALGVEVFGGDCVITADATLHVIDLNDWPSFRACRSAAAAAIAEHLRA